MAFPSLLEKIDPVWLKISTEIQIEERQFLPKCLCFGIVLSNGKHSLSMGSIGQSQEQVVLSPLSTRKQLILINLSSLPLKRISKLGGQGREREVKKKRRKRWN